ncbi:hypothetical protein X793_00455 [Dehalococcoides mccartyi CG4]|uniref:hypothetical protein n=1 Tax=Dehalococcoides mccartyi TaxID=61435 RepID=UPI0004E08619|nr:hypothetical protein [Dehalococcoides mccartyi]AII60159.1 hypothetical protein X793_00455 [Dehalococcoides mccartyi CG4]
MNQATSTESKRLRYEYKSRRKAFDALKNLENVFSATSKSLKNVDIFVSDDGTVLVAVTLSSKVTATDIAKAEGVFSGGKATLKIMPELAPSIRSFKEIYIGSGWKMFRAFGWQKSQNE